MEEREVKIPLSLSRAKDWYNQGGELKNMALGVFKAEELEDANYRRVTCLYDAAEILGLNPYTVEGHYKYIREISVSAAARYKLDIIRKALNKGIPLTFESTLVEFPVIRAFIRDSYLLYKSNIVCLENVLIDGNTYIIALMGVNISRYTGLGDFNTKEGYSRLDLTIGTLGCANKDIAYYLGKTFYRDIVEAAYGDLEIKWNNE